jgi:hypothetical protein
MRPLSNLRFDELAGYASGPMAPFFSEEVSWSNTRTSVFSAAS